MTDEPPLEPMVPELEPDYYEQQYGSRFTIDELRKMVEATAPRCGVCGGGTLHYEAASVDPSIAFLGGLVSPANTEIFLCYIVNCETCGAVRPISREIASKWRGRNG